MSGPLELYRTTVNLRGLGSGTEIEIDPSDPRWAGDIAKRRVVPVGGAVSETYLTDPEPEWRTLGAAADFPAADDPRALERPVCETGPAPDEWVEDWDTGAIVDLGPMVRRESPDGTLIGPGMTQAEVEARAARGDADAKQALRAFHGGV